MMYEWLLCGDIENDVEGDHAAISFGPYPNLLSNINAELRAGAGLETSGWEV